MQAIIDGDAARAGKAMRNYLNQVREELVPLPVNILLPFVDEGM